MCPPYARFLALVFLAGCAVPVMQGDDASPSDAAVADDAAHPIDGATGDAQGHDGGTGFCAPCIRSADCPAGGFCFGGLNPRCGVDCSASACPGSTQCSTVNVGMGPILGMNCRPDDSVCGTSQGVTGACTDTWENYAHAFITTTCSGSCHRHDNTWPTAQDVRVEADTIRLAIDTGNMPQDQTLDDATRRRFLTWLACGAP